MGMGISGLTGPISGIQQGQGMVGNFDANGNLIPGTGGAGNPNGPNPIQTQGGNPGGQLPSVPIDQNGNPTGPATNPGAGPGDNTPGTGMPGMGGKGGMPILFPGGNTQLPSVPIDQNGNPTGPATNPGAGPDINQQPMPIGGAMPGGGGNTSLGGTSVPVQQPAPIGVQQGGTPGRPSPAFPFTPRGPGYANPGGQGVQQQAPQQQAPQQMPLTGNFQPHFNSPHPINPFNQGWNQMGQGILQHGPAPMNVTGPAIPTGPIPNTNFGGLLKGMRRR